MLAHDRQLVLNGLEFTDRATELLALVGVLQRAIEHRLERARHLRRHDGGLQRANVGGHRHHRRGLPLRGRPAHAGIECQRLRADLGPLQVEQTALLAGLHQHRLRHARMAHQRAVHAAVCGQRAACEDAAGFGGVDAGLGQQGANQQGVRQWQRQCMRAALLEHAKHLAQPQPRAALFFRQHGVGQAGCFELIPECGGFRRGVATGLDRAHHLRCALVGEHLTRCIGKHVVVQIVMAIGHCG